MLYYLLDQKHDRRECRRVKENHGGTLHTDDRKLVNSITGGNDALVFQFFAVFSRFECALKRTKFIRRGQYNSAQADWDRFAAEKLDGWLVNATPTEFDHARSYLVQHPPRKQIVKQDNGLAWQPNSRRPKESDAQYLLRLIRDVRNNVFHGGKYPAGQVDGSALRKTELLKSCLVILSECRSLDDQVKACYEDAF